MMIGTDPYENTPSDFEAMLAKARPRKERLDWNAIEAACDEAADRRRQPGRGFWAAVTAAGLAGMIIGGTAVAWWQSADIGRRDVVATPTTRPIATPSIQQGSLPPREDQSPLAPAAIASRESYGSMIRGDLVEVSIGPSFQSLLSERDHRADSNPSEYSWPLENEELRVRPLDARWSDWETF